MNSSTTSVNPPEPTPVGVASAVVSSRNMEQFVVTATRDPEEAGNANMDQTIGNLIVPNGSITLTSIDFVNSKNILIKTQGIIQY